MKQFFYIGAVVAGIVVLSMVVRAQMGMMHGHGMMGQSVVRHQFVMQHGIEEKYAGMKNPIAPSAKSLADGRLLYQQHCTMCHGNTGLGDGEAGKSLDPPPADIAATGKMPFATDGYLYWSIAEGGAPLGTSMPAFKATLNSGQIWKVILYLRQL